MSSAKGIEVGHVFLLGTKYSQAMGATFLDDQGKETLAIMGCYGIGVSRTAAASIEQNHDAKGMIWPAPIAPFYVHLLPVTASEKVQETTQSLYQSLTEAGIEVLWDDRDERARVKFNDADLIGAPYHVTIGDKGLAKGIIEIKDRPTGESGHNRAQPRHRLPGRTTVILSTSTYLNAINCPLYPALPNAGSSPVFPLKSRTYVDKSKNLVLIYLLWKGEVR